MIARVRLPCSKTCGHIGEQLFADLTGNCEDTALGLAVYFRYLGFDG
jgi:hypothetical protein